MGLALVGIFLSEKSLTMCFFQCQKAFRRSEQTVSTSLALKAAILDCDRMSMSCWAILLYLSSYFKEFKCLVLAETRFSRSNSISNLDAKANFTFVLILTVVIPISSIEEIG
jgi:hypothetical protein